MCIQVGYSGVDAHSIEKLGEPIGGRVRIATMRLLVVLMILFVVACGPVDGADVPVVPVVETTTTLQSTAVSPLAGTTPDADEELSHVEHEADSDHQDEEPIDEAANSDRTIEVVMTEYAFEPGTFSVEAGETVTFVVRNDGEDEHEFRLTTVEFADHHITEEHSDHHDDEPGVLLVDPGQVGSMTMTFHTTGEYDVVACLLPDHYELGMVAPLEIGAGLDY